MLDAERLKEISDKIFGTIENENWIMNAAVECAVLDYAAHKKGVSTLELLADLMPIIRDVNKLFPVPTVKEEKNDKD